jgi:ketosteroid isomerase-like protein
MNWNPDKAGAVLLVSIYFGFIGCSNSQVDSEAAIRSILEQQVAEWNAGDIPAFMDTYVKTDDLRFSSGGTVQRGYEATLNRYLTRYPNPEAMGHLQFEDLEVKLLSEEWAQVHGRYRLKRGGEYENATGLFTLLLQHTSEGWKILHDHTSAAE